MVELLASPRLFLGAVLLLGFAPGFVLRLIVKIYPERHSRRDELLGELYSLPLWKRPFFVAEQFETVLFEGLPVRVSFLRLRSRSWLRRQWGTRKATARRIELVFEMAMFALGLATTVPVVAIGALNETSFGPIVINSNKVGAYDVIYALLIWAVVLICFLLARWMRSGAAQMDRE